MRSKVAVIVAALFGLGVSGATTAQAEEAVRAVDTPVPGERSAVTQTTRPAAKPNVTVRSRVIAPTPRAAQATPAGRWRGVSGAGQLGVQAGPAGLDPTLRNAVLGDGASGSRNVQGPSQLPGDASAGGASPVISVRDGGGVVGFSYKIKPQ